MDSQQDKPKRGTKPTDHGTYWTRPTAKPKPGSRPMPARGQLRGK